MTLNYIKDKQDWRQQKVLLRLDLNVPINKKTILDDLKLKKSLPTIKFLLKKQAQIIIISHLGRPQGKSNFKDSLKPIFDYYKIILKNVSMVFVTGNLKLKKTQENIFSNKSRVIFLENIRFYKEEENNDETFAKKLSTLASVYVNDAFAVCHRKNSSVTAITKFLPSFAGINLNEEFKALSKLKKPATPAIAIIGGVKADSKFQMIKNFLPKYKYVLTGGGIANLFLRVRFGNVGASVYDKNFLNQARKMSKSKKIITPVDFVIADAKTKTKIRYHKLQWGKNICEKDEMILDVGPLTLQKYEAIIKKAKTIVWAGPMGFLENKNFIKGSLNLALILVRNKNNKFLSVGGGETNIILKKLKILNKFSFVSTGGGAMLEFLQKDSLPGIKPLKKI